MTLQRLVADWRDERDGHALFDGLRALERNARRRRVFARLADAEARHASQLARRIERSGGALPPFRPTARVHLLLGVARLVGPVSVLPRVAAMEDADAERYLRRLEAGDAQGDAEGDARGDAQGGEVGTAVHLQHEERSNAAALA